MTASSGKKKTKPAPLTDTVALEAISAPDVTDETAYDAAHVMAGRAVERCTCFPMMHAVTNADVHMADCDAPCGLEDVLDALAIREMAQEHHNGI